MWLNLMFLLNPTNLYPLADQVVSLFENATPVVQYCAIEDIHDGRGYTAGKAGFTTATGDLYQLILKYKNSNPDSPFNRIEATLKARADHESPSLEGLEQLPEIWKSVCETQAFVAAQDELTDQFYKTPALRLQEHFKLKSPLAFLILYDTAIQHGDGEGPDSINGVIRKMGDLPRDEFSFLSKFLVARESVLLHPADAATTTAWSESVDRVHALMRLLNARNFELKTPFILQVWNREWHLNDGGFY